MGNLWAKWTANNDDSDDGSVYYTAEEESTHSAGIWNPNQPNCRAIFPKGGPTRAEFKKLVDSKTQSVLSGVLSNKAEDIEMDRKKRMDKRIPESVKIVTNLFCLVENLKAVRSVNKKCPSANFYIEAGVIPKSGTLPDVGSAGELKNAYHTHQKTLFQKLKDKLNRDVTCDENGYFMVDNKRFSTIEFCNALDEVARKFCRAYLNLRRDEKACEIMRRNIEGVFGDSKFILQRRILLDHLVNNNILSPDGYKQWSEHVWVVATFATLIVILETIVKCLPHYNGTLMPK